MGLCCIEFSALCAVLACLFAAAVVQTNLCVADPVSFMPHTPYSVRGYTLLLLIHCFVCCCLLSSLFASAFVLISNCTNFSPYASQEMMGFCCLHISAVYASLPGVLSCCLQLQDSVPSISLMLHMRMLCTGMQLRSSAE